jgi:hypothetical protein
MVCSNEDRGRSRRPSAEDRGWSYRSGTRWPGDRELGWRCVRSAPCTWKLGAWLSWLSLKTKVSGLSVVWPQNHWDGFSSVLASKLMATVCEWFGLKTTRTVFAGLASKPVATFSSDLASKPAAAVSPGLASKHEVGFLVELQNQGGGGFPGLGLKTDSFGLAIWASKSPRWFLGFGLKTKWASICRLHHKTDERRSAWDTRQDLAACFT